MIKIKLAELQQAQTIRSNQIGIEFQTKPVKYYRHGWQSWSLAAWTDLSRLPVQKPVIYHPLQIDPEYAYEKRPNGSWLGAVEFEDGNVLLLGSLATDSHVFLEENQISGIFEDGEGDWFIAFGKEKSIFDEYVQILGMRFGTTKKNTAPRVWSSWYSLYTSIDESILKDIFSELGDLPFDVFQIDDGWQKSIGDWEANSKFPSGMSSLAGYIRSTGRKAGLWLAPLIATKSSLLLQKHADWFLRDEAGRFVSAGFNWGEKLFALDTTHPGAINWLAALMKQVRAWGFDYLKLDFLYAGALTGKRYKDRPREAVYREAVQLMRTSLGTDAFFLACGTPILPALGLCDAIRIGPDVSHDWEKYRDSHLLYNPSIPGTKNAIRTSIHRYWLNQIVHIDPDVAYFAERENGLSKEQKSLLQDLALICKFKASSDLPQWTTPEERDEIRKFLNANPKIASAERYIFQVDERVVDFTAAAALPEIPKGFASLWGKFLGWLGSFPFVLMIIKRLDDQAILKRRNTLPNQYDP
jgi:alpha-galactosidase